MGIGVIASARARMTTHPPASRLPGLVIILGQRLCMLIAVMASAVLMVDYANIGDPAFCGPDSGCMAVRFAPVTQQLQARLPLPLPSIGYLAYVLLFAASLYATERMGRRVVSAFVVGGGISGAMLFFLQATSIGTFCPWCVTVDVAAVGAALFAIVGDFMEPTDEVSEQLQTMRSRVVWGLTLSAFAVFPFLWGSYPVTPPAPASVTSQAVPGKVTIVMFTDFECPFCRQLHPVLEEIDHANEGKIALIRRMKPLSMHPGAKPAALAYLCSPEDKRDEVADLLYGLSPIDMTPTGIQRKLGASGLDRDALTACMAAPATAARLAEDEAMFDALGTSGLPRTYVGSRAIMGAQAKLVRSVVAQELAGSKVALPMAALYALLGLIFVAATWDTSRRARRA